MNVNIGHRYFYNADMQSNKYYNILQHMDGKEICIHIIHTQIYTYIYIHIRNKTYMYIYIYITHKDFRQLMFNLICKPLNHRGNSGIGSWHSGGIHGWRNDGEELWQIVVEI